MNVIPPSRFIVGLALGLSVVTFTAAGADPQTASADAEVFAKADDGTPLTWKVYSPPGGGRRPVVLVIHGGGFIRAVDSPNAHAAAKAISEAGFLVFEITYRLAPPGKIPGQKSDGRFPEQTNDVHLAVHAARVDPRGNGQVGGIGGSAGGYHVAWAALAGTPGDDRLDVGVCLSGAYDLGDPASLEWPGGYAAKVKNYAGAKPEELLRASPVSNVTSAAPPLFLISSQQEAMPAPQMASLAAKLSAAHVSTPQQQLLLPGRRHSWSYWPDIKEQAIKFLKDGFERRAFIGGDNRSQDPEEKLDVGQPTRAGRPSKSD